MTQRFEDSAEQVEFRVFVDKDRAELFSAELGELAASYSGTVVTTTEKSHLSSVRSPEYEANALPYRTDMATEIYEEQSGDKVAVVTKDDFKRFGITQAKYDGSLTSQAFNTILRYASSTTETQSGRPRNPYVARGAWVESADPHSPRRPTQADGILVTRIQELSEKMSADEENIPGFARRSKELFNHFVEELFPYDQDPK